MSGTGLYFQSVFTLLNCECKSYWVVWISFVFYYIDLKWVSLIFLGRLQLCYNKKKTIKILIFHGLAFLLSFVGFTVWSTSSIFHKAFGYAGAWQCFYEVIIAFIYECFYFISSGLLLSFPYRDGFQNCVVWCPRIPGTLDGCKMFHAANIWHGICKSNGKILLASFAHQSLPCCK